MVPTRERIREAAFGEFVAKGESGFRVSAVASVAGCATSVLYHHYGSRAGLIEAAMTEVATRVATSVATRGAESVDAARSSADLASFLVGARERAKDPSRLREEALLAHVRGSGSESEAVASALTRIGAARDESLAGQVAVLRARGMLKDDVDDVIVFAVLDGLDARWRDGRFDDSDVAIARALSATT